MDESQAFYTIGRFNDAGKLVSTAFFGFDGVERVCKGVVVEDARNWSTRTTS